MDEAADSAAGLGHEPAVRDYPLVRNRSGREPGDAEPNILPSIPAANPHRWKQSGDVADVRHQPNAAAVAQQNEAAAPDAD